MARLGERKPASTKLREYSFAIYADQLERVRALSAVTRRPMSTFYREAIDAVLARSKGDDASRY